MIEKEQFKIKSPEIKKTSEQIVNESVDAVLSKKEAEEIANPAVLSEAVQNAKRYLKTGAKYTAAGSGIVALGFLYMTGEMLLGFLEFAKKAIEKKGQLTFKEGYEIGKKIFSKK